MAEVFPQDPTIGAALGGLANSFGSGPRLMLEAWKAGTGIQHEQLQIQQLRQQLQDAAAGRTAADAVTADAPGYATQGAFPPSTPEEVAADLQRRQNLQRYYQALQRQSISLGKPDAAPKLLGQSRADIYGIPNAQQPREVAKALGVDVGTTPSPYVVMNPDGTVSSRGMTFDYGQIPVMPGQAAIKSGDMPANAGPLTDPGVARNTLAQYENRVANGGQLSREEALTVRAIADSPTLGAPPKSTTTTIGGIPQFETKRDFQPISPQMAAHLRNAHGINMPGIEAAPAGVPAATPTVPGATPPATAPGVKPSSEQPPGGVQLQPTPGAELEARKVILASDTYKDWKLSHNAATNVISALKQNNGYGDLAALQALQGALAAHARLPHLGDSPELQKETLSGLERVGEMIKSTTGGTRLTPEQQNYVAHLALSAAQNAYDSYQLETEPTRTTYKKMGLDHEVAVPTIPAPPQYTPLQGGPTTAPVNPLDLIRRRQPQIGAGQ
jgi:hypothetical protein